MPAGLAAGIYLWLPVGLFVLSRLHVVALFAAKYKQLREGPQTRDRPNQY